MMSSMNAVVTPMAIRHATAAAGASRSARRGNVASNATGPDAAVLNFVALDGAAAVRTAIPAVGAVSPAGGAPTDGATPRQRRDAGRQHSCHRDTHQQVRGVVIGSARTTQPRARPGWLNHPKSAGWQPGDNEAGGVYCGDDQHEGGKNVE